MLNLRLTIDSSLSRPKHRLTLMQRARRIKLKNFITIRARYLSSLSHELIKNHAIYADRFYFDILMNLEYIHAFFFGKGNKNLPLLQRCSIFGNETKINSFWTTREFFRNLFAHSTSQIMNIHHLLQSSRAARNLFNVIMAILLCTNKLIT